MTKFIIGILIFWVCTIAFANSNLGTFPADYNEDGYVNPDDLFILASKWLDCTDPEDSNCRQPHFLSDRNDRGQVEIYRNGVPHVDRNGGIRMQYDPSESFFPIGVWGAPLPGLIWGHNYDWQELKDANFNVVWPWYSSTAQSCLAAGQSEGMQIVLMGPRTTDELNQIKGHPNLLANVWMDEPLSQWPNIQPLFDQFVSYRATAHAIIPELKIFVNNVPWISEPATSWWMQWNTEGDISCHDNYPVLPVTPTLAKQPNGIPQVCSLAVEVVNSQKPVWHAVGAFTRSSTSTPDDPYPFRFPTPQQMRSQIFSAVIHGATGIVYFTWDTYIPRDGGCIGISPDPMISYVPNPQEPGYTKPSPATPEQLIQSRLLWAEAKNINSQLIELSPSIFSQTAGEEIVYNFEIKGKDASDWPIGCILKCNPNGGYTMITVNHDDAGLDVAYTFENTLESVTPIFESGEVSLTDANTFTQHYAPFETHIFQVNFMN